MRTTKRIKSVVLRSSLVYIPNVYELHNVSYDNVYDYTVNKAKKLLK